LFSSIILCGGKSRRMGRNKAFVEVDGKPMIQRVINTLKQVSKNIVLVVDNKEKYTQIKGNDYIEIIEDEVKDFGPVEGLYMGLKAVTTQESFVCACDMPFISSVCIEELFKKIVDRNVDCVIPKFKCNSYPLHAFYRKELTYRLEKAIENNQRRLKDFINSIRAYNVKSFDCGIEDSVLSINSLDDLNKTYLKE